MQYAQILERQQLRPPSYAYPTYEWVGKPWWRAWLEEKPSEVTLPWPVIDLGYDRDNLVYWVMRTDGPYVLTALIGLAVYKLRGLWRRVTTKRVCGSCYHWRAPGQCSGFGIGDDPFDVLADVPACPVYNPRSP